jgi:hypothetical protein
MRQADPSREAAVLRLTEHSSSARRPSSPHGHATPLPGWNLTEYRVTVEHVNFPGTSAVADRIRLLARLDALCPPGTDPTSVLGR